MPTSTTRVLELADADLTYDVRGPLPTADGTPPLLMIGQPMDASGFETLAGFFGDRTVITYDPRGLGRSTRRDSSQEHDPRQQAEDLHHLIAALGVGPVDLFGSSGGAVTSLALVAAHPGDVRTVVAHEPPVLRLLPDAEQAFAAEARVGSVYQERGWGAGMAMFIALSSWPGEFTAEFGQQEPDPAAFGLPTEDDGTRDDPLLSGASAAVTAYEPDIAALRAHGIVVAGGIESRGTITWRTSEALAEALDEDLVVFPSHHGGFLGGEFGQQGEPEAFAARLREVLAGAR